jgi:hypothetical protein
MKTSRKKILLSSIAMVLVALVAFGSATYAWFTLNKTVYADSMKVEVAAAKGLVITGTNAAVATNSGWENKYSFTDQTAKLNPASISVASNKVSANTVYATQISSDGKWEDHKSTQGQSAYFGSETTVTPETSGQAYKATNYAAAYEIGVKSKDGNDSLTGINFTLDIEASDVKVQDYIRVAVLEQTGTSTDYTSDSVLKLFGTEETGAKAYPSATGGTPATAVAQTLNPITFTNMKSTGNTVASNISLGKVGDTTNVAKWYTILVWYEGEDGDCVTDNASGDITIKANFSMA